MMLVLALALLARFGSSLSALQKDPSMCENSYNAHHSIVPPLDKAQVYWNFGESHRRAAHHNSRPTHHDPRTHHAPSTTHQAPRTTHHAPRTTHHAPA